jgi:hypothetical protein
LNIDAEGHDFKIVSNFDFDKYRPKLISIEHNSYDLSESMHSPINDLLIKNEYFFASKYGVTCLYIDAKYKDNINKMMSV